MRHAVRMARARQAAADGYKRFAGKAPLVVKLRLQQAIPKAHSSQRTGHAMTIQLHDYADRRVRSDGRSLAVSPALAQSSVGGSSTGGSSSGLSGSSSSSFGSGSSMSGGASVERARASGTSSALTGPIGSEFVRRPACLLPAAVRATVRSRRATTPTAARHRAKPAPDRVPSTRSTPTIWPAPAARSAPRRWFRSTMARVRPAHRFRASPAQVRRGSTTFPSPRSASNSARSANGLRAAPSATPERARRLNLPNVGSAGVGARAGDAPFPVRQAVDRRRKTDVKVRPSPDR